MEISLLTDVNQKRTNNQDYANLFVNRAGKTLIILADGMGGHRAGNIASEMAVTDLGAAWVDTQIGSRLISTLLDKKTNADLTQLFAQTAANAAVEKHRQIGRAHV